MGYRRKLVCKQGRPLIDTWLGKLHMQSNKVGVWMSRLVHSVRSWCTVVCCLGLKPADRCSHQVCTGHPEPKPKGQASTLKYLSLSLTAPFPSVMLPMSQSVKCQPTMDHTQIILKEWKALDNLVKGASSTSVVLTGRSLAIAHIIAVARFAIPLTLRAPKPKYSRYIYSHNVRTEISPSAIENMKRSLGILEKGLEDGGIIYGGYSPPIRKGSITQPISGI